MLLLRRALGLFPVAALLLGIAGLNAFVTEPTFSSLLLFLAAVYGVPVAVFRTLEAWVPLRGRVGSAAEPEPFAHWAAQKTQALFNAVPLLEALMRLWPGLYSAWLRAWGSHVGARVRWPLWLKVSDRSLLDVGDDVVVESSVELIAHEWVSRNGVDVVEIKRIALRSHARIGAQVLIGAGVTVGEGARIGAGAQLGNGVSIDAHGAVSPGAVVMAAPIVEGPTSVTESTELPQ